MAVDNFLASILGDGAPVNIPSGFAQSMMPGPVTDPIKQRRPRLSALDIIGGLSDAVAEMGGAGAGYQPGLDARASRERSIVEQQQKDQIFQQQLAQNQQKFAANEDAFAEVQRGRLGDALAATSSSENPLETWASIADATGLPPEKAQMVTAALTKNPGMAAQLATAFGYTPPAAGSAPREVQLYQLAKKENPNLKFEEFLTSIAEKPLTEYQRGQLGLRETQIGNAYTLGRERNDIARTKATASGKATDGVEMTKTQRGNVNMKVRTLPAVERQLSEVERLAGGLGSTNSGFVAGRLPGGLNAQADAYDKALANLRAQIRQLTRTPGEGSMSDYETRLNSQTLPERADTPEGRAQALSDLRALVTQLRTGYQEMIGSPAPAARGGGRRPPPLRNRGNGGGSAGGWKVIGVK